MGIKRQMEAKKVKRDIEFDFREVQRRNPKTECKTPIEMFTRGPRKKDLKQSKWYDSIKPGR